MNTQSSELTSRLDQLHELLRDITVRAAEDSALTGGYRGIIVSDSPPETLLAPWMAMILVYTEPVRITLTTHFKIRDAGVLASVPLAQSAARVLDADAIDFMKEYSNLAGGRLKKSLQDAELAAGMSLPLVMRGFDYLYMNAADDRMRFSREWIIQGPVTLRCAAMIDVLDPIRFSGTEVRASTTPHGVVDIL